MFHKARMKDLRAPQARIHVTEEIIKAAEKKSSSHCMTAVAIQHNVPGAIRISVDTQTIRWSDPEKGVRYAYLTPRRVQLEIIRFDSGVLPEPFSFTLQGAHVYRMANSTTTLPKRAELQMTSSNSKGIPTLAGGKPPPRQRNRKTKDAPITKWSGQRREFGLRGLRVD